MADQEEFLNIDGAHYAAYNPRYNSKWTINLKDYKYVKEDGSTIGRTDYLRGSDTNEKTSNALGVSFDRTYWGRAAEWYSSLNCNATPSGDGRYINAFGAKPKNSAWGSRGPQFVPKNYGLIPIPSGSGASYPFKTNGIYTSTKFFRYDKKTDACYCGDSETYINTFVNKGPVIFFLACGGGGSGGNSATTFALFGKEGSGGGGGGAGSCFGFIDLRYLDQIVKVECGAGGKAPSDDGQEGRSGGNTIVSRYVNNKYWSSLFTCYGGSGGKGVEWLGDGAGGAGGQRCSLGSSGGGFGLICNYTGKSGGDGGPSSGGSMSASEKIKFDILQDSALPVLNNGVYGTGTSSFYQSDSTHDGGGGGASLLSRHSGYIPLGYGTGGYGGCYRNNRYWYPACDGTSGAFIVLAVD